MSTLKLITTQAIEPALSLLPARMDSSRARAMLLAIGLQESRFEYRRQMNNGPARGFNSLHCLCVQEKIDEPAKRYQRDAGSNQSDYLGVIMADANSIRVPDARSPNGTPLFKRTCHDCGIVTLSDKRRLDKPCIACANKRRSTHGLVRHPLYKLLKNMEARCNYPSASNYEHYGARGIRVCDEWAKDPAAFVAWATANGYRPGLEIDRRDVNGPYAPWNCQFISHQDNSRTRRNAKCDLPRARSVKAALAAGATVTEAAASAGVPKMVAWHISKGNTWKDA